MSELKLIIRARDRDLGGFRVRRLLPYASHRMIGPFVFFDHMGPARFAPGKGMDVRPHPHIHLATVTYLFSGRIHHRDSLGSDQLIEPGAVNWMTAGHGIVHSERTPAEDRTLGSELNGIQCWIALPEKDQETEPSFVHHPASTLPEFAVGGVNLKLLLGAAFGRSSPAHVFSNLFYLDVRMNQNSRLDFPTEGREAGVYVVDGSATVNGTELERGELAVANLGDDLQITATDETRLMILGGENIGPRAIYWNFVSSREENIETAKFEWLKGPGASSRFPKIPGDDREFIPLPNETGPA